MKDDSIDEAQLSHRLLSYLREKLKGPQIEYSFPPKPLQGGYETRTYKFRLRGVREGWSKFLVLRLYPRAYGTHNAIWESTVQNVLAGEGYPVARAPIVCTDMAVLGGAFFIMDYIPGRLLMAAPLETVPELLGKAHAELHRIDPTPLIAALEAQGFDEYAYGLNGRFDWFRDRASRLPWLRGVMDWLIDHRPSESACLAVCHGDFHPLNILVDGEKITGVLDWPGFAIADPVFDVANSIVLMTIPARYVAQSREGFTSVDWDRAVERYLSAYQAHRSLDTTYLDYYKVRRCVRALVEGFEGQAIWQQPLIVEDLIACIQAITGIRVQVPALGSRPRRERR